MKLKAKKVNYKNCLFWGLFIVILDWFFQYYFRKVGFGVANTGISFGIGRELGWLWKVMIPGMFFGFAIFEYATKKILNVYLICLAIGGIGNVLPRFIFGSVWDYIELPMLGLWINLSDVLISVSVLSYILIPDEHSDSL